ncbi:hypothetical protein SAMN05421688_2997 [Poseidonocella pacifica]|uniref:Uncharacterized protein n=1 Tax=Poseidonocella pacifica TaxID=871651 RepID=A0A1I0YGM8_9RHOB|nr:hypothetical protein [Poseidonocella pacifica]SFB11650.1 hypothetical protein SAMN05421688_2997 [Poseidonocella pacifica]
MTDRGAILAFRRDRLGGRLRSMINAMRLAELVDAPLRILWPVGRYAQELAAPEEFFAPEFVEQYFVRDPDEIEALLSRAVPVLAETPLAEHAAKIASGGLLLVESAAGALPFGSTERAAAQAFIETSRKLPFSKRIRDAVDALVPEEGDRAVALHVRRGDLIEPGRWSRRYWPQKYVADEYYDVMIEADPTAPYLLFTDTPATAQRFAERHGVVAAASALDPSLSAAQRDVVELLAIARCDLVLAAATSAFSSAAALMGGARKCALPDDMPEALRQTAETRMLERVRTGPQAFLTLEDYGQAAHGAMDVLEANGHIEEARALQVGVVEAGHDVPHLTRGLVPDAIAAGNDALLLQVAAAARRNRPVRPTQFAKAASVKHVVRDEALAAIGFAGAEAEGDAVRSLARLIFLQHRLGPLDLLARRLAAPLGAGGYDCPPTTLLPYDEQQRLPRGIPALTAQLPALETRFLDGARPLNWQMAMTLDWGDLFFQGRTTLPPFALATMQSLPAHGPMAQSLVALSRPGGIGPEMEAALAEAGEALEPPERALLMKRLAQCALARGDEAAADEPLSIALKLSDHPAFHAFSAARDIGRGRRADALARLCAIQAPPFYVLWQLMKQLPPPERPAVRTRFLAAFDIADPAG